MGGKRCGSGNGDGVIGGIGGANAIAGVLGDATATAVGIYYVILEAGLIVAGRGEEDDVEVRRLGGKMVWEE